MPVTSLRARAALTAVAVLVAGLAVALGEPVPAQAATPPLVGADVSWPQCPRGMGIPSRPTKGMPMPPANRKMIVLGLTNGPAFYPNPCLADQVAFARANHLHTAAYAFTTYPTGTQLARYGRTGPYRGTSYLTKLRNTGYAQARYNVATMRRVGLSVPFLWIDIEPSRAPAPWSKSTARNRVVVDGAIAGYRAAGLKVGFYSTRYLWRTVLGSARYGLPEWRTVGRSTRAGALGSCSGTSFQGGRAVLAQWWAWRLDNDVTCPAFSTSSQLKRYFRKY